METEATIETIARELADADNVFVFAGSGLSAESGIPTYRGEKGLYSDEDLAELAYAETLKNDPGRLLKWFETARRKVLDHDPNPGHYALARMSRRAEYLVATQNVDGLLERACEEENVELDIRHLHGTLFRIICNDCGREVSGDDLHLDEMPHCKECGGLLRPDVVLFGEMLPQQDFDAASIAAETADVCLCLGASGAVHPAAGLPRIAKNHGATIVEINPNPTDLTYLCDFVLRGKTGEILPAINAAVERLSG